MEECRICLEPGMLLHDVCECRGTSGAIHLKCLSQSIYYTKSSICGICNEEYRIAQDKFLKQPKLWIYLDAPVFEFCVRLFLINCLKLGSTLPYTVSFYFNLLLICLYSYSYFDIVKNTMKGEALNYWITPYIYYKNQYYFPLISLIWLIICFFQPLAMIFFYPYTRLYEIHKRIIFILN